LLEVGCWPCHEIREPPSCHAVEICLSCTSLSGNDTPLETPFITYIRESESVLGLGLREDEWHESHGGNTEDLHDMFFNVFVLVRILNCECISFFVPKDEYPEATNRGLD
jgi:hypothetical protein